MSHKEQGSMRQSNLAGSEMSEPVFVDDDDSSASGEEESSVGNNRDADVKAIKGEGTDIGRRESRAVVVARISVIALLLLVTAGVAWGVHYYVQNSEEEDFNKNFEDWSGKVLGSIGSTLDLSLGAIDNLMVSIVSHQETSNSTWPNVTFPDYGLQGSKVLSLSRASVIGMYPRVTNEQRLQWEEYAATHDYWVNQSLFIQKSDPAFKGTKLDTWFPNPYLHSYSGAPLPELPLYYPTWQAAPVVPRYGAYNWDLNIPYGTELSTMESSRTVIMGRTLNLPTNEKEKEEQMSTINWVSDLVGPENHPEEPLFPLYYPIVLHATSSMVVSSLDDEDHRIVGVLAMTIFWRKLIIDILAQHSNGVLAVFGNECNQSLTYLINGPEVQYLGQGDLHNQEFNQFEKRAWLHELGKLSKTEVYTGIPLSGEFCPYWVKLYPSTEMEDDHTSNNPMVYTLVAISIFVFTSTVFLLFDCVSERRQKKVMQVAMQSTAVVSSLFPQVVRDRLFSAKIEEVTKPRPTIETAKLRLQQFIRNDQVDVVDTDRKTGREAGEDAPIAELFSATTVMFADISGFTAWSSVREPAQVFTLLETLYGAFDRIAARRGVFKVETIGDSYVAVAGLPEPRHDHAIVMAKFARNIRDKMAELTEQLGRTLGPDTDGLELRIGLNSGPVTAGVLRGERSRFQLFGDTVNTASRMESTGMVSKIQASESTAILLRSSGKGHWVTKREGQVEAKGKGKIQTYWVEPTTRVGSSITSGEEDEEVEMLVMDEKSRRLVEWNVEIMAKLLKQVVARREAIKELALKRNKQSSGKIVNSVGSGSVMIQITGKPLDEVKEVIMLPEFDPSLAVNPIDINAVELSTSVMTQLREYISLIASLYRDNPFHSFEHASHVTMSVVKLLSRIVAPTERIIQTAEATAGDVVQSLHDHTYGITSDPLTQFACVFSALIHDVDHLGVPNAQLIKEESPLNATYKGKSLAEQNSVDISWRLFVEDQFEDLREVVCPTRAEMLRFRQLVVNGVMATDIMDKDLKTLRNQRWDKAFQEQSNLGETMAVNINRKATIVIEHLIQASDVAHTMQHWHIFRKWNERLFTEMYNAYRAGRAEKCPAEFWYKGEMGFFDFYIIPLAKKLSDCGVFGVSSDEYLNYALKNREEWENRGLEVVSEMLAKLEPPAKPNKPVEEVVEGKEEVSAQLNERSLVEVPKSVSVPESIEVPQP